MKSIKAKDIQNILQKRVETAKDAAEINVAKIWEKYPELKEIENKIRKLQISLLKERLLSTDQSDLAKQLKALRKTRLEYLSTHDLPLDYDLPQYQCKRCNDTGRVNGEFCECYLKLQVEMVFKEGNLNHAEGKTFEQLDLSLYQDSDSRVDDAGVVSSFYAFAKKYAQSSVEEPLPNIIIKGGTGTGKTFLATCFANELWMNNKFVLYITAEDLFACASELIFLRRQYSPDLTRLNQVQQRYDMLYEVPFLIVDDLGTERGSLEDREAELFALLNKRRWPEKRILITTQYTLQEITAIYGKRITYRLVENFKQFTFRGRDIRGKKLIQKSNAEKPR